MNDLKTSFASLDETLIDTTRLSERAVRRGARIRRRRLAAAGAGVAAVLTVAVGVPVGISALGPDQKPAPAPVLSGPPAAVEPVPLSGRATAAALKDLVGQRVPGAFERYEGQDTDPISASKGDVYTYAKLWVRKPSEVATPVMINVQSVDGIGTVNECPAADQIVGGTCRVETRGDWKVILLERPDNTALWRNVLAFNSSAGLRVAVSSTNGADFEKLPRAEGQTRGPHELPTPVVDIPPLTLDQLLEIATWDGWGPTIGKEYADRGAALTPYKDYSERDVESTPLEREGPVASTE